MGKVNINKPVKVMPHTTYAGEIDGVKVRVSADKPLSVSTMKAIVKMCKLVIKKEVSHG